MVGFCEDDGLGEEKNLNETMKHDQSVSLEAGFYKCSLLDAFRTFFE